MLWKFSTGLQEKSEMIKMLNFDTNIDDFDKFRAVNNSAKEKK